MRGVALGERSRRGSRTRRHARHGSPRPAAQLEFQLRKLVSLVSGTTLSHPLVSLGVLENGAVDPSPPLLHFGWLGWRPTAGQ
eukprot:1536806-Prymnesium_polylepis.1